MRLSDRIAIVTGGGAGIGAHTCVAFAKEGVHLAVVDIDAENARKMAEEVRSHGVRAIALEVDVSKGPEVQGMVERAVETFGRLDVLVNNAGIAFAATVVETEEADWDRVMAVNLKSVFLGCKHAIPVMCRQGGGTIVNMTSNSASVGLRRRVAYVASKGAIAAMTRALALDHVDDGIRVNCVAPGTVDSAFFDGLYAAAEDPAALRRELAARQAIKRLGRPEEIATAVLYLACDESSFATGTMLTVDGGMTAQ